MMYLEQREDCFHLNPQVCANINVKFYCVCPSFDSHDITG